MIESFPIRPEMRHYHRLEHDIPVRLEVDGIGIQTTAKNISCGGIFVPDVSLDLNQELPLKLAIALPGQNQPVVLNAQIRRCLEDLDRNTKSLALEFIGLYDSNRMAIDHFVKSKLHRDFDS